MNHIRVESIKSLADEIIVVDTGSTDGTEESINLADEAIRFAIKSNRLDNLGLLLEERTFAEYRQFC